MAEKKVSSKHRNNQNKPSTNKKRTRNTDAVYDDFLVKYGQDLRKRSTRTVIEPKKNTDKIHDKNSARCGEIDPHLAVNPAAEHHILTKRSRRILADDTGFKADDYYSRFELKPEMPEVKAEDSIPAENGFEESIIPGQQTMADMVAENPDAQEISVPVESKITAEEEDPFSNAYKALKNGAPFFGKSEKLRAIARTASDDIGMEPESQLSFPAFDPMFKFDHTDKKKQPAEKKKKEKRTEKNHSSKDFDIDENTIVTSRTVFEEPQDVSGKPETLDISATQKGHRFFDVIDNGEFQEEEPVFEINSKQDIRTTSDNLKKIGRMNLIKTCGLLLFGIITGIISIAFSKSVSDGVYNTIGFTVVNIIFLLLAGIFCIKELAEGVKDILKRKFSVNSGCLMIFIFSLIQAVTAPASSVFPENVKVLVPAAILSMASMTIPRLLLTNNSRLAVSLIGSGNGVSLFRALSESGIEGSVKSKYAAESESARCNTNVMLPSGIMKKLTNAIPKQFGGNISYIVSIGFSLTVGIACGFISSSFAGAITSFSAMLMASMPLSYSLTAAFLLFKENNSLAGSRSSVISYKSAVEATKTKAIVFDAYDVTEGPSCSIHSIKTFGNIDPKKATLCCAAAMKAGNSPLLDIISQVIAQGDEEIPEADDFIVCNGGIAALTDGNKVLLGTKEFLSENHVFVPEDDYEEKYVTGDRKLLFLAVNGELSMILIVSYHVRRSVSAFFKYLASKDISILIHSSDPNVNPAYIEKKCKLEKNSVSALSEAESAYFRDKSMKTESVLDADVFTDGKLSSISALLKAAFRLSQASSLLPAIIFICILAGALAVAVPALLNNVALTGNLYIIIIRIICTVITAAVPVLISEK